MELSFSSLNRTLHKELIAYLRPRGCGLWAWLDVDLKISLPVVVPEPLLHTDTVHSSSRMDFNMKGGKLLAVIADEVCVCAWQSEVAS